MKSKSKMASYGYGGGFKATTMTPAKEKMSMMANRLHGNGWFM